MGKLLRPPLGSHSLSPFCRQTRSLAFATRGNRLWRTYNPLCRTRPSNTHDLQEGHISKLNRYPIYRTRSLLPLHICHIHQLAQCSYRDSTFPLIVSILNIQNGQGQPSSKQESVHTKMPLLDGLPNNGGPSSLGGHFPKTTQKTHIKSRRRGQLGRGGGSRGQ